VEAIPEARVIDAPESPSAPETEEEEASEADAVDAPVSDEPESPVPDDNGESSFPEVPDSASPEQRFDVFRTWLDDQGPRYQVWANDCIFVAVAPPALELEFPKGFRHSHVSATDRDELLLKGTAHYFPDCSLVRVRNRSDDSDRLTHRETVARDVAEAQAELERVIADHADIQTIAAHFDAAIRSVHKDHHAPVPPVLGGEEGR